MQKNARQPRGYIELRRSCDQRMWWKRTKVRFLKRSLSTKVFKRSDYWIAQRLAWSSYSIHSTLLAFKIMRNPCHDELKQKSSWTTDHVGYSLTSPSQQILVVGLEMKFVETRRNWGILEDTCILEETKKEVLVTLTEGIQKWTMIMQQHLGGHEHSDTNSWDAMLFTSLVDILWVKQLMMQFSLHLISNLSLLFCCKSMFSLICLQKWRGKEKRIRRLSWESVMSSLSVLRSGWLGCSCSQFCRSFVAVLSQFCRRVCPRVCSVVSIRVS